MQYTNLSPDVLVSTNWVDAHKSNPKVVIVEVSANPQSFQNGHIPEAIVWNGQASLCDCNQSALVSNNNLNTLVNTSGITSDKTVILYGDNHNLFAVQAFHQLRVYGHPDVRIMSGGRNKWLAEGREISRGH